MKPIIAILVVITLALTFVVSASSQSLQPAKVLPIGAGTKIYMPLSANGHYAAIEYDASNPPDMELVKQQVFRDWKATDELAKEWLAAKNKRP